MKSASWVICALGAGLMFGACGDPSDNAGPPGGREPEGERTQPATGTLRLTLLDIDGKPTPVRVGLKRVRDGKNVSFGSNRLLEREMVAMRAELADTFSHRHGWSGWKPRDCNGVLTLPLAPGRYRVLVQKGIEYEPLLLDLELEAGKETSATRTLRRFRDMPAAGWWSGDTHVHLTRMDDSWNEMIFEAAEAADIHVVNVLKMGDFDRLSFSQYALGEAGRARHDDHEHEIIPGQEEPRTHQIGHVQGLNIVRFVRHRKQYALYDLVLADLKQQGALTGFAHFIGGTHPETGARTDATPQNGADLSVSMYLPLGLIDFLEVIDSSGQMDLGVYYDFLNMGFRIPISAGSDFPFGPSHLGDQRVFVYTGKDDAFSSEKWFASLKQGKTFVSQGPLIDFRVNGQIPGAVVVVEPGSTVRVTATVAGHPLVGSPKTVRLLLHGRPVRSATSEDRDTDEIVATWDISVARSCWMALSVVAHNGAVAHTSPVYIEAGGTSTHDPDRLQDAVNRRLTRLLHLQDSLVEEKLKRKMAKVLTFEHWSKVKRLTYSRNLGVQLQSLEPLKERVRSAILFYENLLEHPPS